MDLRRKRVYQKRFINPEEIYKAFVVKTAPVKNSITAARTMSGNNKITQAIEGYPAEQNICKISAHRPDVRTVRIIVIKFAPFAITPIKEIAAKAR